MSRKRKTTICLEGWYYVVIMGFLATGALLREINLLLAIFGLMLGPLIWNWRHVVLSLGKLKFHREAPRTITAGDSFVVDLCVANERRRGTSWAVAAEDSICREDDTERPLAVRVSFSRLGPKESQRQSYQGRIVRRGRYRIGPLKISTRFPLGLVRRTETLREKSSLLVFPQLGKLTPRWGRWHQKAQQGSRSSHHRRGLVEGDFHSLREYRPGDSRNRIHWRTSARHGELMVRQFEEQKNQDLTLFLDLWQPEQPEQRHRENVELAVSFAATILSDYCHRGGGELLLGVTDDELALLRGPASMGLLSEILEKLALARADAADRLPELLERGLEQSPLRSDLVLISTRAIDLASATRFSILQSDSRKQLCMDRMLTVDASTDELFEYFQPHPGEAAAGVTS